MKNNNFYYYMVAPAFETDLSASLVDEQETTAPKLRVRWRLRLKYIPLGLIP